MGRASRDDGADGLISLAEHFLAEITAARKHFEHEVTTLARAPQGFAAGFVSARARLLAPVCQAEHEASVRGTLALCEAAAAGRRDVERLLLEVQGDPALLRTLERAAQHDLTHVQLRHDFEDAGARLDVSGRRSLCALDASLHQQTLAFRDHAAAGPNAATVRAQLRTEPDAAQREQAWAAFHHHAAAAAGSILEVLRLRRDRARQLGFPHYAAWVDRDAVCMQDTAGWLDAMIEAARQRAQSQPRTPPWDRHIAPPQAETPVLLRDAVVDGLRAAVRPLAPDANLEFDVGPRPGKRRGAWTHVPLLPSEPVRICASLPAQIDLEGVRTLLHELGHAAEALVLRGAPRIAPDALEFSSTMLEPLAWHAPTLHRLTGHSFDPDRLSQARSARRGRRALRQLALARVDRALHAEFDPDTDGSPLPWAHRIYAGVEGEPRDPRDATVATHMHLFGAPHGYAARYATYPVGDALAEHQWAHGGHGAHGDRDLETTLAGLAATLWTPQGRRDPIGMLSRLTQAPASPAAFVRSARV